VCPDAFGVRRIAPRRGDDADTDDPPAGTDPDLGRVRPARRLAQTRAIAPAAVADVHVALDEALSNVATRFRRRGHTEITVVLTLATDELRVAIDH
jgi:hypothetical protein